MYKHSATWNSPLGWGGDDTVLVNSESRSFAGAGTALSMRGAEQHCPCWQWIHKLFTIPGAALLGEGGWDDTVLVDSRSTKYIQGTAYISWSPKQMRRAKEKHHCWYHHNQTACSQLSHKQGRWMSIIRCIWLAFVTVACEPTTGRGGQGVSLVN